MFESNFLKSDSSCGIKPNVHRFDDKFVRNNAALPLVEDNVLH